MTAPEAMTYDSLVSDITIYAERTDSAFTTQIPRFIMLAENRLASEIRTLGFKRFVTSTLNTNDPKFAKPERWRESDSFSILIPSTNKRLYLKYRGYEYCRQFWPNASTSGQPRFYSDYDYEHFFIVATPDLAYSFELSYYERPVPLSAVQQTNWTTQYAPQLLLYGCLLEAQPFLKNSQRIPEFQALYDRAAAAVMHEDQRRMQDGESTRARG